MKVVLNKLLFYQRVAKASIPSVRMHKWKWFLFIHLAYYEMVGLINSYAFNSDGLTRSCVN